MRAGARGGMRLRVDLLTPLNHSLRAHCASQRGIGLLDDREIFTPVKKMVANAPRVAEAEKRRAAALGVGNVVRIVEIGSPEAVGRLPRSERLGHPPVKR